MGHHDLFFKKTFSIHEHAADFIKHPLPSKVVQGIDYSTLTLEKGSYIDDYLTEHFSDTV